MFLRFYAKIFFYTNNIFYAKKYFLRQKTFFTPKTLTKILKDDLGYGFAQYAIIRATCLERCLKKNLGEKFYDQRVIPEIELKFKQRIPYQYLNVAYYNLNKLSEAVAAAYTFFNDAIFYRTYSLLYHKFENMVIFRSGSLSSPALWENYLFVFYQKNSKSAIKVR